MNAWIPKINDNNKHRACFHKIRARIRCSGSFLFFFTLWLWNSANRDNLNFVQISGWLLHMYIIMDIHILSLLYFHYHGVRSTNWEICWSDQSYIDIASSRDSCILDKSAHKQRMINENKQRICNLSNWHVATRWSWKNNSQNRLKPFE